MRCIYAVLERVGKAALVLGLWMIQEGQELEIWAYRKKIGK